MINAIVFDKLFTVEYDCIHGYPALEDEDRDYYDGYGRAYEYLQRKGANNNG